MSINKFQELLNHCRNFVSRMNQNNIPKNLQTSMLRAYIAGYIARNKLKVRLTEHHITELVEL